MTGFEIAGVILGGFPIAIELLEFYQKSFERMQDWWLFQLRFLEFVDSISHQCMLYERNLQWLLNPIVDDDDLFRELTTSREAANLDHWNEIRDDLVKRLGRHTDRFLRILGRMDETMKKLLKTLGVDKDGKTPWLSGTRSTLDYQLQRLRFSFSKRKEKRVLALGKHNQELKEILGWDIETLPLGGRHRSTVSASGHEKIRRYGQKLHAAMECRWHCDCRLPHQTELLLGRRNVERTPPDLTIVFKQPRRLHPISRQICFQHKTSSTASTAINTVATTSQATRTQPDVFLGQDLLDNFHTRMSTTHNSQTLVLSSVGILRNPSQQSTRSTSGQRPRQARFAPSATSASSVGTKIHDLCMTIRQPVNMTNESYGEIEAPDDGAFELFEKGEIDTAPTCLAAILKSPSFDRERRMKVALALANALLQSYCTPWDRSVLWNKDTIQFRESNDGPQIVFPSDFDKSVPSAVSQPVLPERDSIKLAEDQTFELMKKFGIILLELIFNRPIEDRPEYGTICNTIQGADFLIARQWAKEVLGDSGRDVSDAVHRCLGCNFGEMPDLSNKKFRNAFCCVVITPLHQMCAGPWPRGQP